MDKSLREMNNDLRKIVETIAWLVLRINNETIRAAFMDISGHTSTIDVSVSMTKENYKSKIYRTSMVNFMINDSIFTDETPEEKQEMYEWQYEKYNKELNSIIKTLEQILSGKYTKIVEIPILESLKYREVLVVDDGEYKYVEVGAAGPELLYDSNGNKYDKVFMEVGKNDSE